MAEGLIPRLRSHAASVSAQKPKIIFLIIFSRGLLLSESPLGRLWEKDLLNQWISKRRERGLRNLPLPGRSSTFLYISWREVKSSEKKNSAVTCSTCSNWRSLVIQSPIRCLLPRPLTYYKIFDRNQNSSGQNHPKNWGSAVAKKFLSWACAPKMHQKCCLQLIHGRVTQSKTWFTQKHPFCNLAQLRRLQKIAIKRICALIFAFYSQRRIPPGEMHLCTCQKVIWKCSKDIYQMFKTLSK